MVTTDSSSPPQPLPNDVQPDKIGQEIATGILDKKGWHANVDAEAIKAYETGEALSVVFIDADRFKEINDTLGHDVGDEVIAEIGNLVQHVSDQLRIDNKDGQDGREVDKVSITPTAATEPIDLDNTTDPQIKKILDSNPEVREFIDSTPGHVGGDEFAILCKTDEAGARAIVSRVNQAFSEFIDLPKNSKLKELGIRLSAGIASLKVDKAVPPQEAASSMLKEADEDMYRKKLEQLPELSDKEQKALHLAKFILEASGIRMRDLPKYIQKYPASENTEAA